MAVYVLSNPSFDEGIYKIGYSKNVNERLNQLYDTSVPTPFKKELVFDGGYTEEGLIKDTFRSKRINSRREFFRLDMLDFVKIFSIYSDKITYISPELFRRYFQAVEKNVVETIVINTSLPTELLELEHIEELNSHINRRIFLGPEHKRCHFKSKKTAWMALYVCNTDGPYAPPFVWDYGELLKAACDYCFNCDFNMREAIESVEELINEGFLKVENDVVTVLKIFDGDG